ncbi:MAG: DUF1343 domain-containing protein [Taibaiella sp.]|nr:DUF1343 domain-containing protein [Taibaiella sp.]
MKYIITLFILFSGISAYSRHLPDTSIRPAAALSDTYLPLIKGKRVGIIINQTSEYKGTSLLDILLNHGVNVKKIFVPEHGFRGNADAGAHIANTTDSATGLPVISLYGSNKKPAKKYLEGIDVMIYDLQDVGVRFYTYISTMEYCMQACAEQGIPFIVLDRPNPNGFYVDGPVLETDRRSFVGMQQIPIVYGMTAGEYAKMLVGENWFDHASTLDLKVVTCENYTHKKKYHLPIAPSPNLRTMEAVYAYPSLCLFEGTVVSVGRGTDKPFRQYGNPELSSAFTWHFTPQSMTGAAKPPFEGKECYGEYVAPTNAQILKKINNKLQLCWLQRAYNAYPQKEKFFTSFFTNLAGTKSLQKQITNASPVSEIRKSWKKDLDTFLKTRKKYLLYPDF